MSESGFFVLESPGKTKGRTGVQGVDAPLQGVDVNEISPREILGREGPEFDDAINPVSRDKDSSRCQEGDR
jgi:hypothetical protein